MNKHTYTIAMLAASVAFNSMKQEYKQMQTDDTVSFCIDIWQTKDIKDCMRKDSTLLITSGMFRPHELRTVGFYRHKACVREVKSNPGKKYFRY